MGRAKDQLQRVTGNIFARRAAFHSEYLDFDRGIRVGHLDAEERITQIIKKRLAERHGARMICDRWGRGVYWQWICWVPEPNRRAKPSSSACNFSSAKFFVSIDREERVFQSGMQVERAPRRAAEDEEALTLEKDWDWHVLLRALRAEELPRRLRRLLRDGFRIRVGSFDSLVEYDHRRWDLDACRRKAQRFAPSAWGGFQLFWPMSEREVGGTAGPDMIDAIIAMFDEVTPAMNLCMYEPCLRETPPVEE